MRRVVTGLLGAATAAGLLAGCGTDHPVHETSAQATGGPSTAAQPTAPATAHPSPVDDLPAFSRARAPQTTRKSGPWDLVFTDVSVVGHRRFDRIVLEFRGTKGPGWAVNYVDHAVLDGSGEHVHLAGDAFLDIYASGTVWPARGYYDGPRHVRPDGAGEIEDVYVGGTFEGATQVLVGIRGDKAPFRTFALDSPPRLVVDVRDTGS